MPGGGGRRRLTVAGWSRRTSGGRQAPAAAIHPDPQPRRRAPASVRFAPQRPPKSRMPWPARGRPGLGRPGERARGLPGARADLMEDSTDPSWSRCWRPRGGQDDQRRHRRACARRSTSCATTPAGAGRRTPGRRPCRGRPASATSSAARPRRFVCISPWNFPLAIFTGQVTAALAAGNAVLAKPAEQTPLVAACRRAPAAQGGRAAATRCNCCPATAAGWAGR